MRHRTHKRRHSRKSHSRRHRSRRYRGGNAPSPSQYSDAASYQMAVNGTGSEQYSRVFDVNGPGGSTNSNAIIGKQGQVAGKRRHSRRRRGGFLGLGQVINQAIVPFSLLGMQQSYRRKRRG